MNLPIFFKKKSEAKPSSEFSRFFHEYSSAQQKKVIKRAAQNANREQRALFCRNEKVAQ